MINKSNFSFDLEDNKYIEEMILKSVQKKYPKAYLNDDSRYDIFVPETGDSIEVKHDKLSQKTGNYFIETEFDGHPSGINISQANYWVIVDHKRAIWIKTESLRYICDSLIEKRFESDEVIVKGYLIKKEKLLLSPYVSVC